MKLLVILDALEKINPRTDTTLTLIEEACRRGHTVHVCHPNALAIRKGEAWAEQMWPVVSADRELIHCIVCGQESEAALGDFDAVLMRKDPPFDQAYYLDTLLLERARGRTFLMNDPRGLREANEKMFIFEFPELIAPTCVTRSIERIRQCLHGWGGEMIVKPLDQCGGLGVFHVRADDRNTNVILETISDLGHKLVMAQKYLPEARQGDKRILLLDGEPIGAVLRVPRADETRGNLHAGGTAVQTALTEREREICAHVGPRCREAGLYFVGIDVIGGFLTEVNVTSPTGVQEIDRLNNVRLESRVIDWIETRV